VYVREAHPTDGWAMASNRRVGVEAAQPTDREGRAEVAGQCGLRLNISMPLLIDELDDRVGHLYSGMPDRLYVIDRDGTVTYKSGRGPFGFKPGELEQSLILTLAKQDADDAAAPAARVPMLSDSAAWRTLPPVAEGRPGPLPSWARALAAGLPDTTARLLELDYIQRERSPLGPVLRGRLRWVAATANRCDYGRAYAEADLRRAGQTDDDLAKLASGDWIGWPEEEQDALAFARKLTEAADQLGDDEVARLINLHGEERVVAIVLLVAYANYQDRLALALGLGVEPGGPRPPVAVRFERRPPATGPPRWKAEGVEPPPAADRVDDKDWGGLDLAALRRGLDRQRGGEGRIRVPTWEEVVAKVPALAGRPRPSRVQWSLVCYGYQPELTAAWLDAMGTFGAEADQDRVFEESVFWVVTRSIYCFY